VLTDGGADIAGGVTDWTLTREGWETEGVAGESKPHSGVSASVSGVGSAVGVAGVEMGTAGDGDETWAPSCDSTSFGAGLSRGEFKNPSSTSTPSVPASASFSAWVAAVTVSVEFS